MDATPVSKHQNVKKPKIMGRTSEIKRRKDFEGQIKKTKVGIATKYANTSDNQKRIVKSAFLKLK